MLIGLPGSGKSTLAALLSESSNGFLISTDAIRDRLFGDEAVQGPWLKVWREVHRQFQDAVSDIEQGHKSLAIYDATNAVRKQRRQAIALARKTGFTQITGLWLNVPMSICLERNRTRSRQVPEAVIFKMSRRLYGAPPSVDEGLDRVIEIMEW